MGREEGTATWVMTTMRGREAFFLGSAATPNAMSRTEPEIPNAVPCRRRPDLHVARRNGPDSPVWQVEATP